MQHRSPRLPGPHEAMAPTRASQAQRRASRLPAFRRQPCRQPGDHRSAGQLQAQRPEVAAMTAGMPPATHRYVNAEPPRTRRRRRTKSSSVDPGGRPRLRRRAYRLPGAGPARRLHLPHLPVGAGRRPPAYSSSEGWNGSRCSRSVSVRWANRARSSLRPRKRTCRRTSSLKKPTGWTTMPATGALGVVRSRPLPPRPSR